MKRTILFTVAAAVLAAVASIPLVAQGRGAGGRGFGPGGPGGFGPLAVLRDLNLSAAQREQIRAITEDRRADGKPPDARVGELQKQLQLAIFSDGTQPQKLDELKAAIAAAHAEELAARIDVETRIAQVLTPEQRSQARDALAKTGPPDGGRGRRGRR